MRLPESMPTKLLIQIWASPCRASRPGKEVRVYQMFLFQSCPLLGLSCPQFRPPPFHYTPSPPPSALPPSPSYLVQHFRPPTVEKSMQAFLLSLLTHESSQMCFIAHLQQLDQQSSHGICISSAQTALCGMVFSGGSSYGVQMDNNHYHDIFSCIIRTHLLWPTLASCNSTPRSLGCNKVTKLCLSRRFTVPFYWALTGLQFSDCYRKCCTGSIKGMQLLCAYGTPV